MATASCLAAIVRRAALDPGTDGVDLLLLQTIAHHRGAYAEADATLSASPGFS
jgi:hypothetical protein